MINYDDAVKIATVYLHNVQNESEIELVFSDIQEVDVGWVFSYNSKEFIDKGIFSAQLLGNGPLLIDKNGKLTKFGTAHSIDYYLKEYRLNQLIYKTITSKFN